MKNGHVTEKVSINFIRLNEENFNFSENRPGRLAKKDANNRLVKQKKPIAPTTKAGGAILKKLYYELFF